MPLDLPPPVETVTVQAARLPPAPSEAAFAVVEVGPAAIAAAPRLDEALTEVPGVQLFRRLSGQGANPTIQGIAVRGIGGSGAGRALVTLEGAPQNAPFGGWVIWSGLPTVGIEAAKVVRGAGAGPYGAGALTGTVQLFERTSVARRGEYEAYGGERGLRGAAFAAAAGEVLIAAGAEHSDGWIPVRAGRGAADRPLGFNAAGASVRWAPQLAGKDFALRLSGYREAKGGGAVGVNSRAVGAGLSAALADPGAGWRAQAWARHSDFENRSAAVAADRSSATPANEQYATPAWGYGASAAWRGEGWEAGADARLFTGETRERSLFSGAGRIAGGKQSVAGVYAEAWRVEGPWLLTGGVRLDRWDAFDGERNDDGAVTAYADRGGLVPTARAGVRREAGDGFWRAAAYAGFRAPTLNELHRPFRVGADVTEANADLEPERLYGLEGGGGGKGWSVTAFFNRLEGPIANVTVGTTPGGVLRQRRNAGDIDAFGLEAEVEREWETVTARLAGSWTHAEVTDTGLRPAQTPRLAALAQAAWRPVSPLALRLTVRHEGARFDDDLNSRRLSPATEVSLRADWALGKVVTLYAAAENLTDAAVETAETADGLESFDAPRTVRIGLVWRP